MFGFAERLMLDRDVKEYHFVAQAEVVIAGMDDAEEHKATDVGSPHLAHPQTQLNFTLTWWLVGGL